jgi:hypothetical protein
MQTVEAYVRGGRTLSVATTASMRPCAKVPVPVGAGADMDPPKWSAWAAPLLTKSKASCSLESSVLNRSRTFRRSLVPFVFGPCLPFRSGTMASADFCLAFPTRYRPGSHPLAATQTSRDKYSFFRPAAAGFTASRFGNLGFRCLLPAHPPIPAFYPVPVRQVVAVAPASFRPRLAATPLPSLNGSGFLVTGPHRLVHFECRGSCSGLSQLTRSVRIWSARTGPVLVSRSPLMTLPHFAPWRMRVASASSALDAVVGCCTPPPRQTPLPAPPALNRTLPRSTTLAS